MSTLREIILDHEDFFKTRLLQAKYLLKEDSTSWARIRSSLSPKYKFTADLDTFCEVLGVEIRVLPLRPAIWQKNASVVDLYVRYDFEHGQDCAVKEMIIYGLSNKNKLMYYPSLTIPYLQHRFASSVSSELSGVIRLKTEDLLTETQIINTINTWEYVYQNVYQQKLSYDGYHSFLE